MMENLMTKKDFVATHDNDKRVKLMNNKSRQP